MDRALPALREDLVRHAAGRSMTTPPCFCSATTVTRKESLFPSIEKAAASARHKGSMPEREIPAGTLDDVDAVTRAAPDAGRAVHPGRHQAGRARRAAPGGALDSHAHGRPAHRGQSLDGHGRLTTRERAGTEPVVVTYECGGLRPGRQPPVRQPLAAQSDQGTDRGDHCQSTLSRGTAPRAGGLERWRCGAGLRYRPIATPMWSAP